MGMMMGPYGYGAGWGWGWMALGWIMMVIFWGAVIGGIVALVRYWGSRSLPAEPARPETALDILRRRYAAGDLTKEQFETIKRDIA
jgi:putative membrane protein